MPSALKAIIGADAGPFEKEMKVLEDIAARTSRTIESQLGQSRGKAGDITIDDETRRKRGIEEASARLRLGRLRRERAERDQGNVNAAIAAGSIPEGWGKAVELQKKYNAQTRMASAGVMQLVHSLRAGLDSLASGQNPLKVMAQQLPQVAQGLILVGGRFAALGGLIGGAAVVTVGFALGINKAVDALYDVENVGGRGYERNRQFWHKALADARAYAKVLEEQKAAFAKMHHEYAEADSEISELTFKNTMAEIDPKDEKKRHDTLIKKLNSDVDIAQGYVEGERKNQFHPDVSKRMAFLAANKRLLQAQGAVIEENNRHSEADKPNMQVLRGNISELQRVGAYVSPSSVTLVDLNRKMERHLQSIDQKLSNPRGETRNRRRIGAPRF